MSSAFMPAYCSVYLSVLKIEATDENNNYVKLINALFKEMNVSSVDYCPRNFLEALKKALVRIADLRTKTRVRGLQNRKQEY